MTSFANIQKDLNNRMEKAEAVLHHDLSGLRTGRASSALLDSVSVEAYGDKMPLNQLATVSAPEPRLLTVQVWDKSMVPLVEKAISSSGLGLNPSSDGTLVRVPIPLLSEERRKEMAKVASEYTEKARIAIRNIRRDGMDAIKKAEKDGEISKDEHHDKSDEIQKLTDNYIKKLDEALSKKEEDIMSG